MVTLERINAGPVHFRRREPDAAMSRADDAAIAQRVRAADSAFFWPMRLLPRAQRKAIYALHVFCRELDDIADGEASRTLKLALLANWRAEVALLYAGSPQHLATRALHDAVDRFDLRCDDFLAIIDGMEMDARADIRAPSLVQLDLYCERVAVVVGRIALRIFGAATPDGDRVAASLGRAVQLTIILRDLAENAARQRLYLPREMLHAHGIFATRPSCVLAQPALPQVCNAVAAWAASHYAEAEHAIKVSPRRTMREAAAILTAYRAVLDALLARGWMRFDQPTRIPAWRMAALLIGHGLTGR